MYQRTARTLAAATAAGAALAALGLTGAAAAATTSAASAIPIAYTKSTAGYLDGTSGGWDFRFVGATVTVAACQPTSIIPKRADNADATIGLGGSDGAATVTVTCGGGARTITYSDGSAHGSFALSPKVGDVLRISVFRNTAAGTDEFTATDATSGTGLTYPVPAAAAVVYSQADLESVVNDSGITSNPGPNARLWDFRFCNVTSTTGLHKGITGPWSTDRLWDWPHRADLNGSVMYPTVPATGRQFSTHLVSRG